MVAVTDGVVGGPSPLSANLLFAALLLFLALDVVAVRIATGAWRRTRSKQDNFTYWIIQATQGLGLAVALGAPRWLPGLDIGGPTAATVAPAPRSGSHTRPVSLLAAIDWHPDSEVTTMKTLGCEIWVPLCAGSSSGESQLAPRSSGASDPFPITFTLLANSAAGEPDGQS